MIYFLGILLYFLIFFYSFPWKCFMWKLWDRWSVQRNIQHLEIGNNTFSLPYPLPYLFPLSFCWPGFISEVLFHFLHVLVSVAEQVIHLLMSMENPSLSRLLIASFDRNIGYVRRSSSQFWNDISFIILCFNAIRIFFVSER